MASTLSLFRNGAVGLIDWLDRRETVGRKFERHLNFSGTSIGLESPTLETINSGFIEYRKPSALCDRDRCDAPGLSIDVANKETFAFRSRSVWE